MSHNVNKHRAGVRPLCDSWATCTVTIYVTLKWGTMNVHQTDWMSSLNLNFIPWIMQVVVHDHYRFPLHDLTALGFRTISSSSLENPKKYISATWLYRVDFYMWYFDLSCGLFSSMILHCDDGIRHVEAVLEEPTNRTMCMFDLAIVNSYFYMLIATYVTLSVEYSQWVTCYLVFDTILEQ